MCLVGIVERISSNARSGRLFELNKLCATLQVNRKIEMKLDVYILPVLKKMELTNGK